MNPFKRALVYIALCAGLGNGAFLNCWAGQGAENAVITAVHSHAQEAENIIHEPEQQCDDDTACEHKCTHVRLSYNHLRSSRTLSFVDGLVYTTYYTACTPDSHLVYKFIPAQNLYEDVLITRDCDVGFGACIAEHIPSTIILI